MTTKPKKSNKGGEIKKKQGLNGHWYRVSQFESCCDCGLCHQKDYKVIINGEKVKIYFRAWRDKERTERNRLVKQVKN